MKIKKKKIDRALGGVSGKKIAVLGLAFKPNTDDMRESPAITILTELAEKGASLHVYDPEAMEEASWRLKNIEDKVSYYNNEYDVLKDANCIVILTEWNQFRNLDLQRVKELLKEPYFFDFRNIYQRDVLEEHGFVYAGVGV